MPDPYMEAMMHGEFAKKKDVTKNQSKDKYDLAIEKELDKYIDSLDLEKEFRDNKLASPAMKRAQLKEQMKADLQMPELENHISSAISILLSESANYLSPELNKEMDEELKKIQDNLNNLNIESSTIDKIFQNLLGISDPVMEGCFQIAIEKFKEKNYSASLSLLTFLTVLNPANIEYLYRLGIAAQNTENYDLAIKAYEATLELNPELLGALLFASECYFRKKERDIAIQHLTKAKEIAAAQPLDDVWASLISDLEKL